MGRMRSVFGLIGVVLGVLYCGRLLYYFFDVSGSLQGAWDIGLGPTMLGLGTIGLLFCIFLIFRLVRMFRGPRSPGSDARRGPSPPADDDNDGGFDADAAIARYIAQRPLEASSGGSALPAASGGGEPARPPSFGRRVR